MMKKPNIVYVFPDQYRIHAMGFWRKPEYRDALRGVSDPVHTPNLDKFADESIVLTQAVSTCPLCSPYRGMLFSGRYPEQNGVKHNCNNMRTDSLREDITCLTDVLADEGYNVGYIGKWHLDMPVPNCDAKGNYMVENGTHFPDGSKLGDVDLTDSANLYHCCWKAVTPESRRHRIDYWHNYGVNDWRQTTQYRDTDNKRYTVNKWAAAADGDLAVSYIHNDQGQRNEDNPFFLCVGINPPHNPYTEKEHTDMEMFDKYYSEERVPDIWHLLNRPNVPENAEAINFVRYYFSSVTGIDRQFGRIIEALESKGELENTIVVFSSDHGEMMGGHNLGAKNLPHEESYLIPFILRYPRAVSHRLEDLKMAGPDVMPTLLGLAGLKESIPMDLDGTDYSEIFIKGEEAKIEKPKSSLYIYDYPECQRKGVRTDRYTFVIERDEQGNMNKSYIFDNEADPYQMNNLDFEDLSHETLEFLKKELGYWLQKAGDQWYQDRVFEDFINYESVEIS
ncbi:sulfatase [Vallitalea pronyensis]|uniref:Sulfatase n=1 Tax=Vallitalea pronyensis TaxID=1348613 RepID=A0A8J8MP87_9FIRM|nr:sulfatase [Vallitalea pronyensis]QUI25410.1 sulfatase [Vallitalea pronyensis]